MKAVRLKDTFTINNQRYFLDGDSGEIARSRFVTENNKWYYVDGNGKLVKGAQVINGNHYYFNNDYSQVKGAWANSRYYDGDSGQAALSKLVPTNGLTSTKMVKR